MQDTTSTLSEFIPTHAWWKSAVVYQIYPISFFDSNGDGIGDLNGIYAKLNYLKDLGVDVLWLSPIYKSPLADMGYDISDYCDIDPRYGTLADWDNLLKGVHDRGMKLVMDLVVNHTSDEHGWFIESRSSKDAVANPKRNWFVWRPPKFDANGERRPPNNWRSIFQGSAWEYDEKTEEYYLHLYVAKQPDLNWENPVVREAVHDTMRFWLNRGCDGFRMDVINHVSKVPGLPDAPIVDAVSDTQPAYSLFTNGPRVHEYVKELNAKVLSNYDTITVGETPFTHDAEEIVKYVLPANKELNMVFQFEIADLDSHPESPLIHRPWKLTELKRLVEKWQKYRREDGFWNTVFIENHDQARSVSRFGNDSEQWRALSAKLLAMLQTTQSGTLYVYQGEELGMKNFPRSWGIEEYKDVATRNYYNMIKERREKAAGGNEVDMSDVLDGAQRKARDHSRTPVQWDASAHAGFTTGTPWMRVNDDYAIWNAAAQLSDPDSVHGFWKRALRVRKEHDVLIYGDFRLIANDSESVFAYTRSLGPSTALVLMNFTTEAKTFLSNEVAHLVGAKLILSNYRTDDDVFGPTVELNGYEGRVFLK